MATNCVKCLIVIKGKIIQKFGYLEHNPDRVESLQVLVQCSESAQLLTEEDKAG